MNKSCVKCYCLLPIFRRNQNVTNDLDARAQNIDQVHLGKIATILTAAILKTNKKKLTFQTIIPEG